MTYTLGIGPFEWAGKDSPSTHEGRLIFLRLLDGFTCLPTSEKVIKNDAPASLYDRVFLDFVVLILKHFETVLFSETPLASFSSDLSVFLHLRGKVTPKQVGEFLPDHRTLKRVSPETHKRLTSWAEDWNISCGWCLNFAVEAMRLWLFDRYAREFKLCGPALASKSDSFIWDAVVDHATEEGFDGVFLFESVNIRFRSTGWNYRIEEDTEWRKAVSQRFLEHLKLTLSRQEILPDGFLSRVVSRFEAEVEQHIRQKTTSIKERGFKRSPKVKGHAQFAWAVCYQVIGMNLPDVAREFNKPQKTVEDGINRTLTLLGLKKRSRGKRGRKPGNTGRTRKLSIREEFNKKDRLRKFIKAYERVKDPDIKAVIAREIGVTETHFRRVWVPYLLELVGCEDYETLIQRSTITAIKRRHSEILRD
jgi:hypothetical protein